MAWTYVPSNVTAGANRDRLRFRVGDTVANRPLLQDEELDYLLSSGAGLDFNEASAQACEAIAAKITADPDFTHGRIGERKSLIVENYYKLAARFRALRAPTGTQGFLTTSDPKAEPYFDRGMMDYPDTPVGPLKNDEPTV